MRKPMTKNLISSKVMMPTIGVIGINAGIEWLMTGSLKGTPQFGLQTADGLAFASQAIVSGLAWKVYGPMPGILGLLEAVFFVGVKLAMSPNLPIKPLPPPVKPSAITSAVNQLAPGLLTTVERIPGASNLLKSFGISGSVLSQMN
jgi:hypothetical protein